MVGVAARISYMCMALGPFAFTKRIGLSDGFSQLCPEAFITTQAIVKSAHPFLLFIRTVISPARHSR